MELYDPYRYVDAFVATKRRKRSQDNYRNRLEDFLEFLEENEVNWLIIPENIIISYNDKLKLKYARSTIETQQSIIRAFYNYLISLDLLEVNPMSKHLMTVVSRLHWDRDVITLTEYRAYESYFKSASVKKLLVFYSVFPGGLTNREIQFLKKEDLLLTPKGILTIDRGPNKPPCPMTAKCTEYFLEYCKHDRPEDYVFTTKDHNRYNHTSFINDIFDEANKALDGEGVRAFTPKQLRQSLVYWEKNRNVTVKEIMEHLGYKSAAPIYRYKSSESTIQNPLDDL